MAFEISIGDESRQYRHSCTHEDLEDAMDAFNELINQRGWPESDLVVALIDTQTNKKLAQYGLQDFNYQQA